MFCFLVLMIRIKAIRLEIKVTFIGWLNLLLKIVDAYFNVLPLWLGIQKCSEVRKRDAPSRNNRIQP